MNFKFNEDDTILIAFDVYDYEEKYRISFAEYLLGKYDKNLVLSNSQVNERQTLLSWLPFIDSIFIYGETLDKNEIAIVFKSDIIDTIVMEVSDDLYSFLTQRWCFRCKITKKREFYFKNKILFFLILQMLYGKIY